MIVDANVRPNGPGLVDIDAGDVNDDDPVTSGHRTRQLMMQQLASATAPAG